MMKKYDVTVIGGGPAGSMSAIYLKRIGFSVCIFEKKQFPRETLCGELLSKEVIDILYSLGLLEKFHKLHPNPINSFKLFYNDGGFAETKLHFSAYGIKRGKFDHFLLEEARNRGIDIVQPAEVKTISHEEELFRISFTNGINEDEIYSSKVIAAYGNQNTLDKKLKRNFVRTKSRLDGIKFHVDNNYLKDFDKNSFQIFTAANLYCGINTVDENKTTVSYIEHRRRDTVSPKETMKKLIKNHAGLKKFFTEGFDEHVEDLHVYGTGNIFQGKRELVKEGIFMVGDAAHVIAPLAGDGIGMAIQNARLIAEVFQKQRTDKMDIYATENYYIQQWKKLFRNRVMNAKLLQHLLLNNQLRRTCFFIIKKFPALLPKLFNITYN